MLSFTFKALLQLLVLGGGGGKYLLIRIYMFTVLIMIYVIFFYVSGLSLKKIVQIRRSLQLKEGFA